ncbi:DUF3318 domain-containing protein [Gloeocapsa sp. PCC 73106]|uniref:DUF3318 domain-containing protein n=1 Tax=Gloeocapsa sp. PCC 73106 TaxID=102232 RepID=UPI0002ABCB50|nr:DUF3318 domain-containing protein [Gloeocapsa sp. PCC 73106]ELR96266.1 Protein of unknown function (DUF3318) [Gloeocapsa sp. PCC 73106]
MNLDQEITHLLDLMPASGRMFTRIINKPQQSQVIDAPVPKPWNQASRPIYINFDLWRLLSRGERDLLLLATVSNILGIQWFKPNLYQGITLAGLAGLTLQIIQKDTVGIIVAGSLTAIAIRQIWRDNQSLSKQLEADEKALKISQRRGYTEVDAAKSLLSAIEALPQLENRPSLSFVELIRCQNLKVIGNLSPVGVPENLKKQ